KAWASKQTAFFFGASNALQNLELANCKVFRRGRALRIYVRGNLTRCETHLACDTNASTFDRVELRSVCYFCALLNCVSLQTARENVFSSPIKALVLWPGSTAGEIGTAATSPSARSAPQSPSARAR